MGNIDYKRVSKHIDEVYQINVMAADQGDFLITHMPFENLEVTRTGHDDDKAKAMSEEDVYKTIVWNEENQHRFIIVKGNNGTGKSHLIRWLQARMSNELKRLNRDDEMVVSIRRIDNTLRGAVEQLLKQGVVTDLQLKMQMESFVQKAVTLQKQQMMDTILDSFISELEAEGKSGGNSIFSKLDLSSFVEFFRSAPVREELMAEQGPVLRYYEYLTRPQHDVLTASPRFLPEDFKFARDKGFMMKMMPYMSVTNISVALSKLNKNRNQECDKLANLLNRYSKMVIQRISQIGVGNIRQIMTDLRKDLKKQGKNLTVFIEDMTMFTGIDSELITVLSTEHTGEYTDMCRVTSVIGITNAYYDENFKDNFKDRVTHQVLIGKKTFDSQDALCSITARYLNAFFMTREEIQEWMQGGADPEAIPYRIEEPSYKWDKVKVGQEYFTLFPFTKRSLWQLFLRIDEPQRTPRNFLKAVVREQTKAYLRNRLNEELFPSVSSEAIGSESYRFTTEAYSSDFNEMTKAADKDAKEAFRALLCFWGDGTMTRDEKGTKLAGLPVDFILSMKYPFFKPGSLEGLEVSQGGGDSGEEVIVPPVIKELPKQLQNELNDIDQWLHDDKRTLLYSENRRKDIADFLKEAVVWPMEGVPTFFKELYLKDNKSIYIEGQKEKNPSRKTALLAMDRSDETANVLRGLAYRRYLKNWEFEESALYQLKIAVWLEKNKKVIVSKIIDKERIGGLQELLMASMAAEYMYLGVMGGFDRTEVQLRGKLYRKNVSLLEKDRDGSRSGEWGKLSASWKNKAETARFDGNKEILTRVIKAVTGEAQTSSDNVLVWRTVADSAFNTMAANHWDFSSRLEGKKYDDRNSKIETPFALLQEYMPKVKTVLELEKESFFAISETMKEYVDRPKDGESWRDIAEEALSFLKDCNGLYGISFDRELENEIRWVKNSADTIAAIMKNGEVVCADGQYSSLLMFFSSDPIEIYLRRAQKAFDKLQMFADQQKTKYEALLRASVVDDPTAEEADKTIDLIDELVKRLNEEVK
ncbi:hypothetical protein JRC49_10945 [Clostridiales bacterium FE2011]|nr:hypothetical protein JRC49_10945 [Clostridiales bacterium FE2011]